LILDEQATKYRLLDDWFRTPQGLRVAHAFSVELMKFHDVLKGDNLLQMGLCGDNLWLTSLRFRHKWLASPCGLPKPALVTSLNALPIDKNSLDCVIAPLMLEAFLHEKNPIDEIDRVLKSMGYVVFFGVNPWSFWGAALRFGRAGCFGRIHGTLTSSFSLKYTMSERGYRQCSLSNFYYIPPVKNKYLIRSLEFLNVMGKMIWPFPPAFYCLVFQKHQPCLSSWLVDLAKEQPFVLRGSLQPSHQSTHRNSR